jgi:beta-lactamase superfamily II metal-dependent hydrolase
MKIRVLFCLVLLIRASVSQAADLVGERMSAWQAGHLDIHQISTGRGNAGFYVLPDGTTLLVDAGEMPTKTEAHTPDRPDNTTPAGERIVHYIRHFLPDPNQFELDYALMTHFHDDHMGGPTQSSPPSAGGPYKLAGITYVGEFLRIGKLIDRGWPDYSYPAPLDDQATTNYVAFARWQKEHRRVTVERFAPGRNDQVVLVHDPKKYPCFVFQNVAVNGEIWTGQGSSTIKHFPELGSMPPGSVPHENMCSICFRVSYGKFDFFNGGDIPGVVPEGKPAWHDLETPVAKAAGVVDAAILNHHGYLDSMNEFFVATLRPRVWTISVWDRYHPTSVVWDRLVSTKLYPGDRDIFATDVHPANRAEIKGLKNLASDGGHIVLRVAPGGDSFWIFILDHTDESYTIRKVFGPYVVESD